MPVVNKYRTNDITQPCRYTIYDSTNLRSVSSITNCTFSNVRLVTVRAGLLAYGIYSEIRGTRNNYNKSITCKIHSQYQYSRRQQNSQTPYNIFILPFSAHHRFLLRYRKQGISSVVSSMLQSGLFCAKRCALFKVAYA